jgi:hypothetical protein
MPNEEISAIRTRAELARRLASESGPKAAKALREIAEMLDAEADQLENNVVSITSRVQPSGG